MQPFNVNEFCQASTIHNQIQQTQSQQEASSLEDIGKPLTLEIKKKTEQISNESMNITKFNINLNAALFYSEMGLRLGIKLLAVGYRA